MPKVRFLQDRTTKEKEPQAFKQGQVVTFPDTEAGNASAQHWVNRGVAELVDGPQPMHASHDDDDHGHDLPARTGGFGSPVKGATTPVVAETKKGK